MKLKEIIDFHKRIDDDDNGVGIDDEEFSLYLENFGEYLNARSEDGKKIVLSKMKEEDFVVTLRAVKAAILTNMNECGTGGFLSMAGVVGELDTFIHTVTLVTIGILAEEEVI